MMIRILTILSVFALANCAKRTDKKTDRNATESSQLENEDGFNATLMTYLNQGMENQEAGSGDAAASSQECHRDDVHEQPAPESTEGSSEGNSGDAEVVNDSESANTMEAMLTEGSGEKEDGCSMEECEEAQPIEIVEEDDDEKEEENEKEHEHGSCDGERQRDHIKMVSICQVEGDWMVMKVKSRLIDLGDACVHLRCVHKNMFEEVLDGKESGKTREVSPHGGRGIAWICEEVSADAEMPVSSDNPPPQSSESGEGSTSIPEEPEEQTMPGSEGDSEQVNLCPKIRLPALECPAIEDGSEGTICSVSIEGKTYEAKALCGGDRYAKQMLMSEICPVVSKMDIDHKQLYDSIKCSTSGQ